jgi:enoyl-CoA hydratase
MPFEYILTEKREKLGIISLNQPDRMNAINQSVLTELLQAISLFESDREVTAVCFTGTGSRAFCAGLELNALRDMEPLTAYRFVRWGQSLVNRIEGLSKPTIAAVNGLALGAGFEIVLACDLVAAVPQAAFGFPEVRVGMIPAWGGTRRLADIVGRRKVKELVYMGELLTAEQALQLGVINTVVPVEELMDQVLAWMDKMSAGGRVALWQAKKVLEREAGMSQEGAQSLEAECFSLCFSTTELGNRVQDYMSRRGAVEAPAREPEPIAEEVEEPGFFTEEVEEPGFFTEEVEEPESAEEEAEAEEEDTTAGQGEIAGSDFFD